MIEMYISIIYIKEGVIMAGDKHLSSGNTSMLLLQLLSEKDMYGYEMIETLEKRSESVFSLKAGTMYPLLHTMESQQLLESYEKEFQGKVRRYYSITREGRRTLAKKKEAWNTYSRAMEQVIGGILYGNA